MQANTASDSSAQLCCVSRTQYVLSQIATYNTRSLFPSFRSCCLGLLRHRKVLIVGCHVVDDILVLSSNTVHPVQPRPHVLRILIYSHLAPHLFHTVLDDRSHLVAKCRVIAFYSLRCRQAACQRAAYGELRQTSRPSGMDYSKRRSVTPILPAASRCK